MQYYLSDGQVDTCLAYSIIQPFFELQTPDFAWKFVWTVPTIYGKKFWSGASEGGCTGASGGNSAIF